jgi:pimeloyl-ACP methyl ester carboxylesterase
MQVMWILAIAAGALLFGALAQSHCLRRDRRRAPPGRMVSGLHVHETGSDGPPVVFEAGLAATSLNWRLVEQALATRARTWSYDRAGLGWSRRSGEDRSLRRWTDDLQQLVRALGVPTPFVLTAHSFGTFIARVYASRFPHDVAAVVLIDPVLPQEFSPLSWQTRLRLARATFFSRLTGLCARFGLVRLGLWGLLRRGPGKPGPILGTSATLRRIAAELAKLPADTVAALRGHWSDPRFFHELAESIRAMPRCAAEAATYTLPSGLPVVVISGGHQPAALLAAHAALATRHVIVEGSAHWVHLDRPALVADEILAALDTTPHRARRDADGDQFDQRMRSEG